MNAITRAAAALCLFAAITAAQMITRPEADTRRKYEAICAYDVSAAVPSLVIHLPATITGTKVRFGSISVRTPEAASAKFEWGGATPSGGTNATVRKRNTTATAVVTAKCNATSATPTSTATFPLASTDTDYVFDAADDEFLPGGLTGRTLRVTLSGAVTGTGQIIVQFTEGL